MALVSAPDVTEAVRELLRTHTFTDSTRADAQKQVRHLVEDRVFCGRKPPHHGGDFILISVSDVERDYALGRELSSAMTTVEVGCYSTSRRRMFLLWEGVRQALTSLKTTVTIQGGTLFIAGCTLESESEPSPDEPQDGSDEFVFTYLGYFRITHDQTSPTGVA
jgi:hypothetical protein